jgi:hypothetical protein
VNRIRSGGCPSLQRRRHPVAVRCPWAVAEASS